MQQNAYLCATKATQKIYCIKDFIHLLAKVGGFLLLKNMRNALRNNKCLVA